MKMMLLACKILALMLLTFWLPYAVVTSSLLSAQTSAGPAIDNGQTYEVVWSCFPRAGCYAELLKIDRVSVDGWADVHNCRYTNETTIECKEKWRVNLNMALSLRPHQAAAGRAAMQWRTPDDGGRRAVSLLR